MSVQSYYKVLDNSELPDHAIGDVFQCEKGFGDNWAMLGYLCPCDSKGDEVEPGKQLLIRVETEFNRELVTVGGEKLTATGKLPDGTLDPASGLDTKAIKEGIKITPKEKDAAK
jgi:hypothetical protein